MRQKVAHLLLMVAVLALVPLQGPVLCVGADGHGAIEPVDAACCQPGRTRPDEEAVGDRGGQCADGCVDTPISLRAAVGIGKPGRGASLGRGFASVALADVTPSSASASIESAGSASSPRHPPRHLRTTVQLR